MGQQQHPQQNWAQYADMPVGEILRRTRIYYGLSLGDVESALRIRASQLSALEEGQLEKLPGRVYAIGFVRAYAEFLGLDGDKMVQLFKAQMVGNKPRPELSFPVPASESKLPNLYILSASFAGLVLVVILFMIMGGMASTKDIPAVPQNLKMADAGFYGPPVPPALLAEIEPASGVAEESDELSHRVIIDVVDSAWVEIRNAGGDILLSRVLKEGDSYLVPNEPGLRMDTGNIGALHFTVDGESLDNLGESGDIRRGVSLDPDALKISPERYAQQKDTEEIARPLPDPANISDIVE